MSLSGSNRRPTDRVSRKKAENEIIEPVVDSSSSSKRKATTQSSQRKPVAIEEKSNVTKRIQTSQPSQKLSTSESSKRKPITNETETPAGITFRVNDPKKSEKLPVSTISKRQTVVPAAEAKKSSGKLPITEPKKTSAKIPIAKPTIVPPSTTSSTRRSSSMETAIVKPQIGSSNSKKLAMAEDKADAPIEPIKSSTKRARAGASGSSQKNGRASSRGASRGGSYSQKNLNIIYFVLGGILLVVVILLANSLMKNPKGKVTTRLNELDQGKELCYQSQRIYNQDNEKVGDALRMLEDGISKMESELNRLRGSDGNLPANYAGYDTQLANWLGYRKMLREQNLINSARKERSRK